MNRLGGDVVRKICGMLEIMDADKAVVHLALTCKRMHHFLKEDLSRLKRIYSMADYCTWSRTNWAVKRTERRRKSFIEGAIRNLLPPTYFFDLQRYPDGADRMAIWTFGGEKWSFSCSRVSIQVVRGARYFCRLWIDDDGVSIDWNVEDEPGVKDVRYPQFKSQLAPILAVYPQLMDELFNYFNQ